VNNSQPNGLIPEEQTNVAAKTKRLRGLAVAALAGVATAATVALRVSAAERANPPKGAFIAVDGVRLHYVERGAGVPIVMLHGNGVSSDDFLTSGVVDRLARAGHRVIVFDRPGFGYSERPRKRPWAPLAQAKLVHAALKDMKVSQATIVAHSWGTLVAIALTLSYPQDVRGLVLASGYYYPTLRADVPLMSAPAIPLIGDVLRYTTSPVLGRLLAPLLVKQLFAPAPVAESFEQFPLAMSLRPSALRAAAADTARMIGAALRLQGRYAEIGVPVDIVAGSGDLVANTSLQSARLAKAVSDGTFHPVSGAGHMVHHTAPGRIIAAVEANLAKSNFAKSA